jgi:hypothetical protein
MKRVQDRVQLRVFISEVLNDHLIFAESDVGDTYPIHIIIIIIIIIII